MTLRLRIVSQHRRSLGDRSSFVLGVAGGSIGRSVDNDWVLPDPQRYVSAHHARIVHREGHFFLEDVSTNGSYVNDASSPLGGQAHQLRNGDLLRLGEYHIVVALESEKPAQAVVSVEQADLGVPTSINSLHTIGRVSQTDIGAQLNVNDLLVREPVRPGTDAPAVAAGPASQSLLSEDSSDSSIARRISRFAKAVTRASRNNASGPPVEALQSGLEAFCRGAGIESDKLQPDAHARMMHLAGLLLREALVGLKDMERARTETRNRLRIDIPLDADDPRPSLTGLTVDDLIVNLLNQHETRRIDAVQWLREALSSAKEHEAAVTQAMRSALVEFLDRLDPAELEARFERAARRGNANASDRAQYWQLYTEFYRTLIEMPADNQLPHTFIEAFATAYRDLLKKSA